MVRRRARALHVAKLDLSPDPVSITSEAGGDQQITHNYTGRSLRKLENIIRAGDIVELRITVKVTGASGTVVQAHRTTRLQT